MKTIFVALLSVAGCAGLSRSPSPVWHDEFNGPAGASFDRAKWAADTGGLGFGNQEREFYTTRPENVALDGQGHLIITARAEPSSSPYQCWYGKCGYTSTRLKTKGLFAQRYGRFEARIRIPRGQGMWPAFWMLGTDIDSVGWPRSGEIDIMENIGREPAIAHGAHGIAMRRYSVWSSRSVIDAMKSHTARWSPSAAQRSDASGGSVRGFST